jgi:hypothetical protein
MTSLAKAEDFSRFKRPSTLSHTKLCDEGYLEIGYPPTLSQPIAEKQSVFRERVSAYTKVKVW